MKPYSLNDLREMYLKFFEEKEHLRLSSFSLVPKNDPSILLINAGMTPLKPYFTGQEKPPKNRITTCQKCIRTLDIDNVGITSRHGTFFEMLGNFSFGDYFKKEIIPWSWEFLTKILEIPEDKLYVSIYLDDDEAFEIWTKDVGLSEDKLVRLGKEDNFWEHGIGPCGPCSEIHFDRGSKYGCDKPDCQVGCDCDRYIEVWNLVFTQFNRKEDGSYAPLAKKNIDTGMGLERLACVMQSVENLFEVDTIRKILDYVIKIANKKYGVEHKSDVSIRVITDHTRSAAMMVADGVLPSNEGRGYILRRLIRRAARHGKLLGIERQFITEVIEIAIKESGSAYHNLVEKRDYIKKVIKTEEEKFDMTIDQGLKILNEYIDEAKADKKNRLSGKKAFKLHDTFGFPVDLTKEIAEENGMSIDEDGFNNEMQIQKNMARDAFKKKEGSAWDKDIFSELEENPTEFLGYESTSCNSNIYAVFSEEEMTEKLEEGEKGTIVLNKTVFYAESGGQVGDKGIIKSDIMTFVVKNTTKTTGGMFLHQGFVKTGSVKKYANVIAEYDQRTRRATESNHTVTHILQKALQEVLGEHVAQSGSLVTPDRLRFDFTHFETVTAKALQEIENKVNTIILSDKKVQTKVMSIDEAREEGAMALFGEKYGDTVRVVVVDGYSKELCGGTHISNTAKASLIKIVSESGIAAGVRRIEALTGFSAINWYKKRNDVLIKAAKAIKATPEDIVNKIENLNKELKGTKKELEKLNSKLAQSSIDNLENDINEVNDVKIAIQRLDDLDMKGLRDTADKLKVKLKSCVVVLATGKGGKVNFVVSASKDAVNKGIHSGNIIREVAKVANGGGGGRPDMAQAGAKEVSKIDDALELANTLITKALS